MNSRTGDLGEDRRRLFRRKDTHMKLLAPIAAAILIATPVASQQLVVGLGYADFSDGAGNDTVELDIEYHFDPFRDFGRWTLTAGGVLTVDQEGDAFLGAGISSVYDFNEKWFRPRSFGTGSHPK